MYLGSELSTTKKRNITKALPGFSEAFYRDPWAALMQLKPTQSKNTQEMKSLPQYPSLAHSNYTFLPGLLLSVHYRGNAEERTKAP